jgi:hypothetical protein
MEDQPRSLTRKWGALRVVGGATILLGIAAAIAANSVVVGLFANWLRFAALGLAFLGLVLLSVYRNTVIVIPQPGDLTGHPEVSSDGSAGDGGRPGGPPLSEETEKRIALLFDPTQQETVRALLLRDCGHNLYAAANETEMDRLRFSVLKASHGSLDRLTDAIRLAKTDWRDAMSAAGFAWSPEKHKSWLPKKKW